MSTENQTNLVENVEFGTTQPNILEMTDEEMARQAERNEMYLAIGRSTFEWAVFATRDEYIAHMLELYDGFHAEDENVEEV